MTTEAASGPVPNNRQPIASVAHTLGLLLINVGIAVLGDRGPDALDRRLGVGGGTQRSGSALLVAHRHGVGAALLHLASRSAWYPAFVHSCTRLVRYLWGLREAPATRAFQSERRLPGCANATCSES